MNYYLNRMREADKDDPDYAQAMELIPRQEPPPPKQMLQHLRTVSSRESEQMKLGVPEIKQKPRKTAIPSS